MEIERKFLPLNRYFVQQAIHCKRIKQAYLSTSQFNTVRVRIIDQEAVITIKGASLDGGLSRPEWEYSIPKEDAVQMMHYARPGVIEKVRYYVPYEGFMWEVDVFEGALEGLLLAEVELEQITDNPPLPAWIGREVTGDKRYHNGYLSRNMQLPPLQ